MSITVINPWHNPARISNSRPTLAYDGKPLLSYRGVEVYRGWGDSYDYTYKGMAITQRAGMSDKAKARAIIDAYLDGDESAYANETVVAHIASHRES